MTLKMPERKKIADEFINNAPNEDTSKNEKIENINRTQIISFSLQKRDIDWLDKKTEALINLTRKRVNRTKLITAGLIALQRMNNEQILEILKEL
ncbi:MAG: hypothetical protein ACD_79C00182G0006 [uncultured bacterium]|nr:MAG: hypothetical protein ACD_79C00182G0006 [uncultured bacterium]